MKLFLFYYNIASIFELWLIKRSIRENIPYVDANLGVIDKAFEI